MPRKKRQSVCQVKKGVWKRKKIHVAGKSEEKTDHMNYEPSSCMNGSETVNSDIEIEVSGCEDPRSLSVPVEIDHDYCYTATCTRMSLPNVPSAKVPIPTDEIRTAVTEECISVSDEIIESHIHVDYLADENANILSEEPSTRADEQTSIHNAADVDSPNFQYRLLGEEVTKNVSDKFIVRNSNQIQILELYDNGYTPSVKLTVNINLDYSCDIYVHEKKIGADHDLWLTLPKKFSNLSDVTKLLTRLEQFSVCMGNSDDEYTSLTPIGSGLSDNKEPTIVAYHEGDFNAKLGAHTYHSTIRSVKCELLVHGTRCRCCSSYRRLLKKRKERIDQADQLDRDFTKSTFKHSDMSRSMLLTKIKQQKEQIKTLQHDILRMKRECDQAITKHGILLQKYEDIELKQLVFSCQTDVEKAFPDSNCRQRLFWQQQLLRLNTEATRMRWHPMIIRWCLYLRQKSSKAYEALRESGFITLPSSRTLFDYSHYIKSQLGFQPDVLKMLKEEAEKKGLFDCEWRSYVGLLFDEIHVKQDLVYDKNSGELIGYCNLDSVGNDMMALQDILSGTSQSKLAKCMLVVMLRSCTSSFTFPVCGFATMSITADYLYPIIWKTISVLETQLKLRVLFLTCDGASPNRRFFNLHKVDQDGYVFKTVNLFDPTRNIYFISDVPHLLKTVRNCVSNSNSHRRTRSLWKNGRDISWMHIVKLFEEHCELNLYTPCPKLTRCHIDLQSYSYMKVHLAAQVFSDSVATGLEELYGPEVSETVTLIRHMNKFFDCLNVRSLFEGQNKKNLNLQPFRDPNDERLIYLLNDFLNYFNSWEDEVRNRPGNFTTSDRASMLLSHQSLLGLKISVKSICECVKYLLEIGEDFVLTHTFNQDPLEQHFGHYRHRAGANNNPSVHQVRSIMTTLRTVGAQALPPLRGNITRQGIDNIDNNFIDNSKLPKRKGN